MRERGSALLTSVIAIMVLLMISGVFFTFVNYQFRLETSEEKGLKAFYMAEAGINYGLAMVKNDLEQPTSIQKYFVEGSPYITDKTDPLKSLVLNKQYVDPSKGKTSEGSFDIYLQVEPLATSEENFVFTLTSFGYYPDKQGVKRVLEEHYTLPKPKQTEP